jgi:hypothetical protein
MLSSEIRPWNWLFVWQRKDFQQVSRTSKKIKVELGNPRDWNAEYRRIMDTEPKTVEEQSKKFKSIASLTQDFEYTGTHRFLNMVIVYI